MLSIPQPASQGEKQDSDSSLSDSNGTWRWSLHIVEPLGRAGPGDDSPVGELARNLLALYFSLLVPNWLFHSFLLPITEIGFLADLPANMLLRMCSWWVTWRGEGCCIIQGLLQLQGIISLI